MLAQDKFGSVRVSKYLHGVPFTLKVYPSIVHKFKYELFLTKNPESVMCRSTLQANLNRMEKFMREFPLDY